MGIIELQLKNQLNLIYKFMLIKYFLLYSYWFISLKRILPSQNIGLFSIPNF